jgi:hypothetical protein
VWGIPQAAAVRPFDARLALFVLVERAAQQARELGFDFLD